PAAAHPYRAESENASARVLTASLLTIGSKQKSVASWLPQCRQGSRTTLAPAFEPGRAEGEVREPVPDAGDVAPPSWMRQSRIRSSWRVRTLLLGETEGSTLSEQYTGNAACAVTARRCRWCLCRSSQCWMSRYTGPESETAKTCPALS